jgi:DNA topoisomerase-3
MAALVRHFGDLADSQKPCGICDFCAPTSCAGQTFRPATEAERAAVHRVVASLRQSGSNTTGKLHSELYPDGGLSRDEFEEVLGSMARAGLARLTEAVFEKDGRSIPYRKVSLTPQAADVDTEGTLDLRIKAAIERKRKRKKRAKREDRPKRAAKGKRAAKPAPAPPDEDEGPPEYFDSPPDWDSLSPEPPAARPAPPRDFESWRADKTVRDSETAERLEGLLKSWRLSEAKRRNVPAFRIFSDQALKAIATKRPATASELLSIPGIGISTVEKYGAQLYRLLHEGRS